MLLSMSNLEKTKIVIEHATILWGFSFSRGSLSSKDKKLIFLGCRQMWNQYEQNVIKYLLKADSRINYADVYSLHSFFPFNCTQSFFIVTIFVQLQDIDFGGFKIFMDIFLEVDTPDELCRHLFLSFVRMPQCTNTEGKTLQVKH